MNIFKIYLPYLTYMLVLWSCKESSPAISGVAESVTDLSPALSVAGSDSAIGQETQADIVYDTTEYPKDTLFPAKILTTGTFHEDEVAADVVDMEWWGIFQEDEGYFLSRTTLQLSRVYDPILDEDMATDSTGWEVATDKPLPSVILITGVPSLQEKAVGSASLGKVILLPGDTLVIDYLGHSYTLYATGEKGKAGEGTDWTELWNYKLYLRSSKEGVTHTQLLVAQPDFHDERIDILFAGDIDGDGKLDLVIDISNHYNATSPTLYLSKPALSKELLKVVARHTSVGC